MGDMIVLFGSAFIGGIIIVFGSLLILGRKVSEPKRDLQQRVASLEKELENSKQ